MKERSIDSIDRGAVECDRERGDGDEVDEGGRLEDGVDCDGETVCVLCGMKNLGLREEEDGDSQVRAERKNKSGEDKK
ncbi:protein of unknown function [Taphrina deformans PYCC 5710]|uniref:Uncharacterized protein n=1 Tax=Taphrina deformans (strain PYCC 5710 / ATCC 11124 / CBS 356.35 / IMI 108563 / JCM 9778 / NBRC 8474) TaxID=1097556 RepID=R4X7W4_TAPDE|nr:protein of unknown function [Taphrina deformans PYCC 5710]|eukprot:CCG81525.1 protein of unknown function [Taphrina deformans PYCC 5710]